MQVTKESSNIWEKGTFSINFYCEIEAKIM